jgi:hypothetical protein
LKPPTVKLSTRRSYRDLGLSITSVHDYPTERNLHRTVPTAETDEENVTQHFHDLSSPLPSPTVPLHPITSMSSTPNYRAGKAPNLDSRDPAAVKQYVSRLEFFFVLAKHATPADDAIRIRYAGMGLLDSELQGWFSSGETELVGKSWSLFIQEFYRRALPHDYVFKILLQLRNTPQGSQDFGTWATRMRSLQSEVGKAVMPDVDLVREMVFQMDVQLQQVTRKSYTLRGTRLHEEDLDTLGITGSPAVIVTPTAGTEADG